VSRVRVPDGSPEKTFENAHLTGVFEGFSFLVKIGCLGSFALCATFVQLFLFCAAWEDVEENISSTISVIFPSWLSVR